MGAVAFTGAAVFDGRTLHQGKAVLAGDAALQIIDAANLPADKRAITLSGGTLMPGFVDLQVNGGGGVMLNDSPDVATLRRIADAHRGLGTRALLPTLITDTPEKTRAAIDAVAEALADRVPGIVGLHLEGPHLDPRRAGAHDPALIRPMTEADMALLLDAARTLPNLMVTLAPESATTDQIAVLAKAGVILSLGHSDCDYETARTAFEAGANCATHLFNAMSQLGSRAPGLVGAALDSGPVFAGLIADGVHVHAASIRLALAANQGPGAVFLVSDAMATAGSDIEQFTLNGRHVLRRDGRLTLADGTLAGADLTLGEALRTMVEDVGEPLSRALARATSLPASLLRDAMVAGRWPPSLDGLIYLDAAYQARAATDLV